MRIPSLLFLMVLIACDSPGESSENLVFDENSIQQWKLVKMTGSFSGSETTGMDMEWQETYDFNTNLSFTKTRISKNGAMSASGTFRIEEQNGETFLLLTYAEQSTIVGSCLGKDSETLVLTNKSQSLQSTWWACDGPGLFYERFD